MNFSIDFITVEEMNKKLKNLKNCNFIELIKDGNKKGTLRPINYGTSVVFQESASKFTIYINEGSLKHKKIRGYCCRFDDNEAQFEYATPVQVYTNLRQYDHDFPIIDEELCPFDEKVSAILFNNPKYERKWIEAESYDMNSAYGWAACQELPDTRYQLGSGIVAEGQLGFTLHGDLRFPGEHAQWRFPASKRTGFHKFMNKWYEKKRNATTPAEKKKAKEYIIKSVGYLQNRNFWLRATIVGHVNRLLKSVVSLKINFDRNEYYTTNDNILYGNTDSIIVKKGYKLDLKVGDNMGEWKLDNEGFFTFIGFNHQWKGELPSVRGKNTYNIDAETYDLATEALPITILPYRYDREKQEVVRWQE